MNNGWFRVRFPNGNESIIRVERNHTSMGSVVSLEELGVSFEEVMIITMSDYELAQQSVWNSGYERGREEMVKLLEEYANAI